MWIERMLLIDSLLITMNTIKTILVAVDFSTGSRTALEQAVRLASIRNAKLHVLHILDSAALAAHAGSRGEAYESMAESSAAGARQALVQWLQPVALPPACESTIVIGNPLHEILEQVKATQADLLVAGITGSGDAPAGAGSVAGRLARKAQCMVLLVRANHPNPFRKIVAAVDYSDHAREVVAQARQLAMFEGASVDFLHVWQEPWGVMPFAMPMADAGVPVELVTPEQREAYVASLHKELEEFVGPPTPGIASNLVLHQAGNHGRGIAAHAEASGADLIIVGIKGRTNLKYVLMGSTAERLLTTLPCSLLVLKPVKD